MTKKSINRSSSEMQADRIHSQIIFQQTITDMNLINLGQVSFKSMGTFSLSIRPILISGIAPASLTVTFNKLISNKQLAGASHFITILTAGINSDPDAIIVNVDDLLPDSVFTDLEITVQSTDNADIDFIVSVTGD